MEGGNDKWQEWWIDKSSYYSDGNKDANYEKTERLMFGKSYFFSKSCQSMCLLI